MRAIAKFTTGILRVENPPISRVRVQRAADSDELVVYATIRFAFDAVRVVSNGGRTVRLELKTGVNPQIPSASTSSGASADPSFNSIMSVESAHDKKVKGITVAIHNFDIIKSIPDFAIPSLKSGHPIQYSYLQAVPASQRPVSPRANSVSDRDYLLAKLQAGIDPATLREHFPVLDPAKGSTNSMSKIRPSHYTRPVASQSNYRRMKIYSTYQIFEKEIEMTAREFLTSSVYEFSYLDYTGTPIEYVEVNVRPSSILDEMEKLAFTDPNGNLSKINPLSLSPVSVVTFEREIISTSSLVSTEFTIEKQQSRSKKPKIKRTHYATSNNTKLSLPFKSEVYGLPSKRSKVAGKPNSSKPSVIPFYVTNEAVVIKKLPPESMSVSVTYRNITKGDKSHNELRRVRVSSENNVRVPIRLPEIDCVYELKVIASDRKQRKKESCNVIIYDNRREYKNASLRVSSPILLGDQKVKFKITAGFTDAGRQDLTNLINTINASGVSSTVLSAEGYTSDSNLYSDIFSCKIEKINLETGEQSYTKEIAVGTTGVEFIDKATSESGTVYIFSLGIKSPSSLIPSQPFYKFGTFGGRYLTSLPSDARLVQESKSGADFYFVNSGIKRILEVPTTRLSGKISRMSLTKTMRDSNLIEWVYDGDLTEIDHFQVFGSADGVECLLGCSFKALAFEDRELYDRVGVVKYRVCPVHVSLTPGDSFEISAYRGKTLPTILDVKFSNGQPWRDPKVAVNSQIVVDTIESLDASYEDFYRTSVGSKEPSLQKTAKKKLETSSGIASVTVLERSSPSLTFNPAPIIESNQLIVPVTPFTASAASTLQISGKSSTNDSLIAQQSSLQSIDQVVEDQPISYKRVLR